MSISKQSLLGAVFLLTGASILFYAMNQQPETSATALISNSDQTAVISADGANPNNALETVELEETDNTLTTDIATEAKILDEKEKKRQAQVAAQEAKALKFLKEKEEAAANALAKAREENEAFLANRTQAVPKSNNNGSSSSSSASSSYKSRTNNTSSNHPKRPYKYKVRKGEGLIKIAEKYNIPLLALAEVNDMSVSEPLMVNQVIKMPRQQDESYLVSKAKKRERQLNVERKIKAKAKAEHKVKQEAERKEKIAAENSRKEQEALKSTSAKRDATKKLAEARAKVKQENAKGTFGVQVALAANQEKADEIAKSFREAGYQVKTSKTSRGVRVMVGPERGKIAALALKDKINSDPKLKVRNAWVLFWR